ncbi:hypothetical protein HJD18_13245 [Thermoleophilia bacterium SCSIO 60948]|nr:hypothetical protein HJD18_13245 [Thermoleophilia bacterium SCSIO 60948]
MGEDERESAGAEANEGRRRRRPSRRVVLGLALALTLIAAALVLILTDGEGEVCCAPDPTTSAGSAGGEPGGGPVGEVEGLDRTEQIDQVLLIGFEGSKVDGDILDVASERALGGVLIGSENWDDASAGRKLVSGLEKVALDSGDVPPPLIVTAQEGGVHRALDDLPPEATQTQIADEGDPDAVVEWAEGAAKELKASGFDLDLFPIADVATLDSPLGDRVFSDSTRLVEELTVEAIEGCEEADLLCAPAHFPGLGAAAGDTDAAPSGVSLDERTLKARDLTPFRSAFETGAPAVVVSLAFYSAIDGTTPAALSRPITTDLLRRDLGFKGAAITDDLSAGAIRGSYDPGEAAVRALDAGADMVQISDPDEAEAARRAIEKALDEGDLSPDRLAEAVERVLELKRDAGLIEDEPEESDRAGDSGGDGGSGGEGGGDRGKGDSGARSEGSATEGAGGSNDGDSDATAEDSGSEDRGSGRE